MHASARSKHTCSANAVCQCRGAAADGRGSQANTGKDAAQAAGSTAGKPDAAQRPRSPAAKPDAAAAASNSVVVSGSRSAAAQGTSQKERRLALSKAAAKASPKTLCIAPAPPRGQVSMMLSSGGPARLLRWLRSRCSETGNTIWMELVAMIHEPVDRCVPA
jgi:hypothetical protein